MKRKKIWIPLVIFFAVMLIATAVSENIYYNFLPAVVKGKAVQGTLSASYRVQGMVEYQKVQSALCAEFSYESVTLLAADGDALMMYDPVYSVSPDEIQLLQKKTELTLLDLKAQGETLCPDGNIAELSERERLQYEINELQIAEVNAQLETLARLVRQGGRVLAGADGVVSYTIRSGAPVQKGQSIAEITSNTDQSVVTWQMDAARGELFGPGNTVEVNLKVWEGGDESAEGERKAVTAPCDLLISKSEFSNQTQTYQLRAGIPADLSSAMADGERVMVNCKYESEEEYSCIVPVSALTLEKDIDGNAARGYIYGILTRERIYGTEYYVMPFYVEIVKILDNYAALGSVPGNFYDLVFETDQPLENNMAVKLKYGN